MERKPKILIVDDEKDIVSILKSGLERRGYDVDGYNDPRQALAGFRKQQYDLVILDIKMPHLNGFELSREISKVDEDAKIGFMSAFDVNLNEAKAVFPTLKVLFFIRKPVSLTRLAEQISAFVS